MDQDQDVYPGFFLEGFFFFQYCEYYLWKQKPEHLIILLENGAN